MIDWELQAKEFSNCNCAYGCPCQFNALPTEGHCRAIVALDVTKGHFGGVTLDGVRAIGALLWPGPIHAGGGKAFMIVDEGASEDQRNAMLAIMSGQETDPGATVFSVFASTLEEVFEPVFKPIDLDIDVEERTARVKVDGLIEMRGEPILNPVSGAVHRAQIHLPNGFEYLVAEMGRGWSSSKGPVSMELEDSYGQFAHLHLSPTGPVKAAA